MSADGYDDASAAQVARLARFEFVPDRTRTATSVATLPIAGGAVQVLPSDAFDAEEAARAARREARAARAEIERGEGKLANEGFVEKAPAEVVEGERRKLDEYRRAARAAGLMNAARRPRSTCSASSCSACASGSTACTS